MLAFYHHEFYKKQTNTHKQKQVSIPTFAFCPTCPLFSWFLWAVATQWQRCVLNMSVCLSAVAASLQCNVGMNHTGSHPPYPLLPCATSSSTAAHKGVKNWADRAEDSGDGNPRHQVWSYKEPTQNSLAPNPPPKCVCWAKIHRNLSYFKILQKYFKN